MPRAILSAGLVVLAASCALAQSPNLPAFDVASIKLNPPGIPGAMVQFLPGGRFVGTNTPVIYVIQRAYNVEDFQIVGQPRWLIEDRFEMQAKGPESAGEDQVWLMVQTLLADRFHLKLHRETREIPVYALIAGKGGLKIQPRPSAEGRKGIGWNKDGIIATNESLAALGLTLTRELGRPVVDKTGISGTYDFTIKYDPHLSGVSDAPPGDNGPSIFTALPEQLGLKLESQKAPFEFLVIDHIERPSGN